MHLLFDFGLEKNLKSLNLEERVKFNAAHLHIQVQYESFVRDKVLYKSKKIPNVTLNASPEADNTVAAGCYGRE